MTNGILPGLCVLASLLTFLPTHAQSSRLVRPGVEQAAPPAVLEYRAVEPARNGPRPAAGPTAYSIGEPTDTEQAYLELLNRARLFPTAEGIRLRDTTDPDIRNAYYQEYPDGTLRWKVDTNLFATLMKAIPPVAPLAFQPQLLAAARGHSQWMLDRAVQSHDQDGVSTSQRITAAGYNWGAVAENVFSFAHSAEHGHAGFEVDWGDGPNGMQEPPGHRINNHHSMFREIGIGVVKGVNTRLEGTNVVEVGPQLVTMNFGVSPNPVALVTGVVYFDLNHNGFYEEGEGLGGVRVDVSGSGYFAVTTASGGYAVPTADGARTVTFTAPNLSPRTRDIVIVSNANQKVDLILEYTQPVLTGPASVEVGTDSFFSTAPVPAATGYQLKIVRRDPYTVIEGAEGALTGVALDTSPGYSVVGSGVKAAEGVNTFHLAHPGDDATAPQVQYLKLNANLRAGPNARWRFASRLGFATPDQIARAQVSTNGGVSWVDIYSRAGTGNKGETVLTRRTNSLAAIAGQQFQARFVYDLKAGEFTYFPQTDAGFGFYVDEIAFDDVEQVVELGVTDAATPDAIRFRAPGVGTFALAVRPIAGTRVLPYGPAMIVNAASVVALPVVRLSPPVVGPNGKLRLDFVLESGTPSLFALEGADTLGGTWAPLTTATLTTNSSTTFTYRWTPSAGNAYLRVRVK